jgi:hypothetical protein
MAIASVTTDNASRGYIANPPFTNRSIISSSGFP